MATVLTPPALITTTLVIGQGPAGPKGDISDGSGGALINDAITTTSNVWSSTKVQAELDAIETGGPGGSEINDSVTATDSTWSSTKTNAQIVAKTEINDAATTGNRTWSSNKVQSKLDALDLSGDVAINDAATSTSSVWSSNKTNTSIGALINDGAPSTSKAWSSTKTKVELDAIELTPGADGDSAYQVAVDNGFVGNEAAWLASLHGTNGTDAGKVLDEDVITAATYTVAGSSKGLITGNRASAITVTLPTRTTDATLEVRRPYLIRLINTGPIAFSAGSGATIVKEDSRAATLAALHAPVTAMLVSDTQWWLFGALDAA